MAKKDLDLLKEIEVYLLRDRQTFHLYVKLYNLINKIENGGK